MKKTIYKPWTENTCPLKVGDVLRDPLNKRDIMVTVRIHSATYKDDPDENIVVLGDCPYSGQELLDYGIECWDNYPDKGTSYKCCEAHLVEVEEEHWIYDMLGEEMLSVSNENTIVHEATDKFIDSVINKKSISEVTVYGNDFKTAIYKQYGPIQYDSKEREWLYKIDLIIYRYIKEITDVEN